MNKSELNPMTININIGKQGAPGPQGPIVLVGSHHFVCPYNDTSAIMAVREK